MNDPDLAARLVAARRANGAGLAACAVVLGIVAAVVGVLGGGGTSLLVVAGLGSAAAGAAVLGVDAWWALPRPEPKVQGGATVARLGSVPAVAMLLGATAFALLVAFAIGGGVLESAVERRRGGLVLLAGVPLAAILLVWAVVVAARPGRLVLSDGGISFRGFGRAVDLPWDALDSVEVEPDSPGATVGIDGGGAGMLVVPTRHLGVGALALRDALRHYRDHPADRVELGTSVSLARLRGDPSGPAGGDGG